MVNPTHVQYLVSILRKREAEGQTLMEQDPSVPPTIMFFINQHAGSMDSSSRLAYAVTLLDEVSQQYRPIPSHHKIPILQWLSTAPFQSSQTNTASAPTINHALDQSDAGARCIPATVSFKDDNRVELLIQVDQQQLRQLNEISQQRQRSLTQTNQQQQLPSLSEASQQNRLAETSPQHLQQMTVLNERRRLIEISMQHLRDQLHLSRQGAHSSRRMPTNLPIPLPVHTTSLTEAQAPPIAENLRKESSEVASPAIARMVGARGEYGREYVEADGKVDILLGRGKRNQRNPGNIRYLKEVHRIASEYHKASPHSILRTALTQDLVEGVRKYGGRFLEHDGNGWYVVNQTRAHNKACQSLREAKLTREERREKAQRFQNKKKKQKLEASASGFVSSDESQPQTS